MELSLAAVSLYFPNYDSIGIHRHGGRRSNIPDIGLGRLMPDGARHLQGGAEQKAATEVMRNFPNPADIIKDPILA